MTKVKKCSFCGIELTKNNKGIEGIDAIICHQCLDLYGELANMTEYRNLDNSFLKPELDKDITPKYIFDELSKSVVGQLDAKKILSVALYHHYKRMNSKNNTLEKSNMVFALLQFSGGDFHCAIKEYSDNFMETRKNTTKFTTVVDTPKNR